MTPALDVRLFWFSFWTYLAAFSFSSCTRRCANADSGMATVVFLAAFALQTAGLAARWIMTTHPPLSTMYEYALTMSWAVALSFFVVMARLRRMVLGVIVSPVLLLVLVIASLLPKEASKQLMPALQSYWFYIHVTLAACAEGAFIVAAGAGIVYLFRRKKPARRIFFPRATCSRRSSPARFASAIRSSRSAPCSPGRYGRSTRGAGSGAGIPRRRARSSYGSTTPCCCTRTCAGPGAGNARRHVDHRSRDRDPFVPRKSLLRRHARLRLTRVLPPILPRACSRARRAARHAGTPSASPAHGAGADIPANEPIGALLLGSERKCPAPSPPPAQDYLIRRIFRSRRILPARATAK